MGKGKKLKQPKVINNQGGVSLKTTFSLDGEFDYPVFCFKFLHKDYDFEICKSADQKFLRGFVTKIKTLSDMTWTQIQFADRKTIGSEKITRKSLNVPLPVKITKDVNDLLSFRFSGTDGRIIGYRNNNILHVIYIDTKLDVYPH
jgi:hypothetical protein